MAKTQFRAAKINRTCFHLAKGLDYVQLIDSVMCDYGYLLNGQRERRPNSSVFQAGEFAQLFQEVLDTIDLIFQNGIDWKAFARTFAQVQVQYADSPLQSPPREPVAAIAAQFAAGRGVF